MPDAHDTETLAEVLAAHVQVSGFDEIGVWHPYGCACSWTGASDADHRTHVATILAARIKQARAGEGALRERMEALADELGLEVEERRTEAAGMDEQSWPLTRAEFVGFTAGLGDAQTQLTRALTDTAGDRT